MASNIYDYRFMLAGTPLGYQFEPTNVELIQYYLLKKVNGEPLPYNFISKYKMYGDQGKEPWK
ncbi:hypothetical protein Gogos_002101, partial [Gossypium gossypioides]|nr:hypothetical protein [Gossypium gossypioides]